MCCFRLSEFPASSQVPTERGVPGRDNDQRGGRSDRV